MLERERQLALNEDRHARAEALREKFKPVNAVFIAFAQEVIAPFAMSQDATADVTVATGLSHALEHSGPVYFQLDVNWSRSTLVRQRIGPDKAEKVFFAKDTLVITPVEEGGFRVNFLRARVELPAGTVPGNFPNVAPLEATEHCRNFFELQTFVLQSLDFPSSPQQI